MLRRIGPPTTADDPGIENDQLVEGLTQHLAGSLAAPSASAAAEVHMDSGSSITATSEEPVQALRGQLGMTQTALTQEFVGHARVVTDVVGPGV